MANKVDWEAWNKERQRFRERETQGFECDLKALEDHIAKLTAVAPKDKAGWMNLNALDVVNLLKKDLARVKTFMGMV